MTRILVISYSQSGEVEQAFQSFTGPLARADVEIVHERICSTRTYPYPWKSPYEFFDVFPECVNLEPPDIEAPAFDPDEKFDLIILAYQVWFLAPSLPIQGFLQSPYARVFQETPVITMIVCRSMWYTASETMKEMIAAVGGELIDNIVVTFKGPALATFITTPRKVLSGRNDKFLGLPEAETNSEDIERLKQFGQIVASRLHELNAPTNRSLLRGQGVVKVNRYIALLERVGYVTYHNPWAKLARRFGKAGDPRRKPIIYLFMFTLVLTMPTGILLASLVQPIVSLVFARDINAYLHRLSQPSGAIS